MQPTNQNPQSVQQGMKAGPGQSAPQETPYNQQHHQQYNDLRNHMLGLVSNGVPGMSDVLNALNASQTKQIQKLGQNKQAQPQGQTGQPQQQVPAAVMQQLLQAIQGAGRPAMTPPPPPVGRQQ